MKPAVYHIVIIGANFAGLNAARHFGENFRVTIVDSWPHFEFLPNIHELISGIKKPGNLRFRRGPYFSRLGHRFVQKTVERIDPQKGKVFCRDGAAIPFDFCVAAVGGVNNTFGIKGAGEFAYSFKSVNDCTAIGEKLDELVKTAKKSSVVIVGGGLEGIEALGEILRRYRKYDGLKIELVEINERLLIETIPSLDREIRNICKAFQVSFHTGERVKEVAPDSIHLESGKILKSDLTVWTGGAAANPLMERSGLAEKPGEWAPVKRSLQSNFHENVFVAGDAASFPGPIGKQAYYALDMGKLAAENIKRIVEGDELTEFVPTPRPKIIAFGDLSTFIAGKETAIAGIVLAGAKESVFQMNMTSLEKPVNFRSLFDFFGRAKSSVTGLLFPTITSFSALKRMTGVKVFEN